MSKRLTTATQRRQLAGLVEAPIKGAQLTLVEAESLMGDSEEVQLLRDVVQQHLEKRRIYYQPMIDPRPDWEVWTTLTLGSFNDTRQLIATVKRIGWELDRGTEKVIRQSTLSQPAMLQLTRTTLRQLGITNVDYTDDQLWSTVKRNWLEPCPIEAVPLLCLRYQNAPEKPILPCMKRAAFEYYDEWIQVLLSIEKDSDREPATKWIMCRHARPYGLDTELVFAIKA